MEQKNVLVRITLLSALILFLEMLLIRWIGTEVRIFAYLQNGVLVAAFLGLGMGARNARAPVRMLAAVVCLALIALVIRDPFGWGIAENLTQGLIAFEDTIVWGQVTGHQGDMGLARWGAIAWSLAGTIALLGAAAWCFHPLGQLLGRWIDQSPHAIAAYTANIAGSIVGIALFDAATIAATPPWAWLVLGGVAFAAATPYAEDPKPARIAAAILALLLPVFAYNPGGGIRTTWSPYQKLELSAGNRVTASGEQLESCGELIRVNNTGYQAFVDLDPAHWAKRPAIYTPELIGGSHYVYPYQIVGRHDRVLIVGAGAGNDAAAALQAGAKYVHAVEIDPVIYEWGHERHPNHPYSSPKVEVTIDDARAFFRRHEGRYDVIWFGLLDSHTSPSAYTNVRLDHFIYTRESFADMKRLLEPDGVVVLFFAAHTGWITDRLRGVLAETFGTQPLTAGFSSPSPCLGWGGTMLIAGSSQALQGVAARAASAGPFNPRVAIAKPLPLPVKLTTDDWPYLYLAGPSLPTYHIFVAIAALLIGLVLRRRLFRAGEALEMPMLLLGMGFMLLEVAGVSRAALLFGTTWTVNAYVIAAILSMTLAANYIASRIRVNPLGWPFVGLAIAIVALAMVPIGWLAQLPFGARVAVGGAFLALPVLFSGLVFVSLWARSPRKDLAIGSNLLGALVGGIASMLTMLIGFRSLTFLTLAVYLAALYVARRAKPATSS
jgi:SAM-dependent methyltransferase